MLNLILLPIISQKCMETFNQNMDKIELVNLDDNYC